ncbi:MAG TPA: hypothetical protein VNN21_03050 [Dehalococcoidia bacterium]|nr:hypothetical protein [Dehalococcoidia bacterium]
MSRNDDLRFYGLYNLVEVKATGRIGMYVGSVLASPEQGGDWMEVRFEDGTEWRYRPDNLKRPKGPSRIFDTARYTFTKSAPPLWQRVWQEWSAENAVAQLMGTLEMHAARQREPDCWADEAGLLGVLMEVWFEEGVCGRLGRYTRDRLRLAWRLTFHEDLPPDEEVEAYLREIRPAMEADRCCYLQEQSARWAKQEREQLALAVAAGRYAGAPRQTALPGFE